MGGDGDGLGGTGIPIIGLKPGNRHYTAVITVVKLLSVKRVILISFIFLYISGTNGTEVSGQSSKPS